MRWFLAIAILLSAAGSTYAQDAKSPTTWPDTSLYQLDYRWVDQDGATRSLSDVAGKRVVVAMIFTRCKYACPLIINHIKTLEGKLTEKEREDLRVVFVSLDPTNDTPAVLKEFAKERGMDLKRWTLLNGSEADVRALSVVLNTRFKQTGEGEFSHGRDVIVLDRMGRIVYLGQDFEQELKALRAD